MISDTVRAAPAGLLLRHHRTWFAVRGVLALLFGMFALFYPFGALFAFTMLFAAYSFVDGIASLVGGFTTGTKERWWAQLLRGIVGIVVGVIFVLMPYIATLSYAAVSLGLIAAWAIISGLFEVVAAVRLRKEIRGEWLLALSGAVSILLGIAIPVFLALHPLATILSVGWMIGIWAIIAGVALLALSMRLKEPAGKDPAPAAA